MAAAGSETVTVLVFTNMYPFAAMPYYGSFVHDEVTALRAAGCDVDVLFVNGKKNKLSYLASPWWFWRALGRRRYDVVHVHHSFTGFVAAMQRRVPVVWTCHEGELAAVTSSVRRDRPIKRLAYSASFKRFVARRMSRVIVVSEHLKDPLRRQDAVTIPSGLDMSLFVPADLREARAALGWDMNARYVLFPSSPRRLEKRFDLARKCVDLLGGNLATRLVCLDGVPHEKVPVYMNAADALLMTSSFEASPVTVREALSCNLPVVSTDVGDVRELLAGLDGCYVTGDRPEDIAAALRLVLRRAHRIAGRERVADLSLEKTAGRVMAVYEALAGGRHRDA